MASSIKSDMIVLEKITCGRWITEYLTKIFFWIYNAISY